MLKAIVNKDKVFELEDENGKLILNGEQVNPDIAKVSDGVYHVIYNNQSYQVQVIDKNNDKHLEVSINGNHYEVELQDRYDMLLERLGLENIASGRAEDINAPMPGLVIQVLVKEGQEVEPDMPLIILEAMKMENVIKAEAAGIVKAVHVANKEAVEKNQLLISFE